MISYEIRRDERLEDMEQFWDERGLTETEASLAPEASVTSLASLGPVLGQQTPAQTLADAVITQAFRDLAVTDKRINKKSYETAREFLLGETVETAEARQMYCEVLGLDPAYIERMARDLLLQGLGRPHEAPTTKKAKTTISRRAA